MDKRHCGASVRMVVEFAMLSGSLTPGSQLDRMREGVLGHQARQTSLPQARTEVMVSGEVEGEIAVLKVSGRIDALYERDSIPVVEELKLGDEESPPQAAIPVHRAQAVCYGYLLDVPEAIIRVMYIRRDGTEIAAFEERMTAGQMREAFDGWVAPYLHNVEEHLRWMDTRDASLRGLSFPFAGYRAGQREMAVQVYWAVKSRRRLFAQAPTGTGKTAAALYPALKALCEGLTGQIFYLTARTTGQENASGAIERMRRAGLRARVLRMTAKEKICPQALAARRAKEPPATADGELPPATREPWRCDVLTCAYAIGFFDRLPQALDAMRKRDDWSREAVEAIAEEYVVCPFEFALSLCEEADVVIGDYNYAFDPGARIRRIFQWTTNVTLLVDEAHNLPDRARDMLSARLSGRELREQRRMLGKMLGRKARPYAAMSKLLHVVEAMEPGICADIPPELRTAVEECMDAVFSVAGEVPLGELPRTLIVALGALQRFDERYTALVERQGRHTEVLLFCLDPAPHLAEATRKLRGSIYFSATLTPLSAWREVIGGVPEDALLSLPSPFPEENLLVLRHALSTKYRAREKTAGHVAQAILAVAQARPGNYLACFPSYAYLRRVAEELETRPEGIELHIQRGGMNDAAREEYLAAFAPREKGAMVGMVVMGGIFGEGVDLPGDRLSGVIIVGVGLPQIGMEREALRGYYQEKAGNGFAQAYRYPGMNKVLQAVGRVIRTETDRGVVLLIDDRFLSAEYAELMPPWWSPADVIRDLDDLRGRLSAFWESGNSG